MANLAYLEITAKEHEAAPTTDTALKPRQYWDDMEVLMAP